MALFGWVIVFAAFCVVAVGTTLGRKRVGTRRRWWLFASSALYLAVAGFGLALTFGSVLGGVASALASVPVVAALLWASTPTERG